ncbi:hypothetical protein [Umezawaea sp. Da 62-37]|uniref:hypothetical protein n=1 Tax=Umezawaea sp. Da 62-37 TaxID=3075927 RepID=UPI0028F6CC19|nr:hypothetical protein [Umezawaea sp. Da 62-37]WNV84732.1 hypothetical protein RM788_42310 [Umezawaea sp. Da 62-37]
MSEEPRDEGTALLRDVLHARRLLGHHIEAAHLPLVGTPPTDDVDGVALWSLAHQDRVLSVVRSVISAGEPELAALLLSQVWPLVPAKVDETWCRRLRDCGTGLAGVLPDSVVLSEAFRASAAVFAERGLYRVAEIEGMRDLAIWRKRDERDGLVAALTALVRTYRARDRLHMVMECASEWLHVYLRHKDPVGVAWALGYIGALMLEGDRAESAVDYLARADTAYETLSGTPPRQRAEAMVLWGIALWRTGARSRARSQFSRALTLVVDVDEKAAGRVRALVSTPAAEPVSWSVSEVVHHRERDLDQ